MNQINNNNVQVTLTGRGGGRVIGEGAGRGRDWNHLESKYTT